MLLLKAMRMSVTFADSRNYVDVYWSCYHQSSCFCPWFVLLPRSSVVVHADVGNHVDSCDLYCCQKLCRSQWSMMLLIVEDKEDFFAVVSINANSQLRARGYCVVEYLYTIWGHTNVIGVIKYWMINTWEGHIGRTSRQTENSD